jgi:hypothetical protein
MRLVIAQHSDLAKDAVHPLLGGSAQFDGVVADLLVVPW